MKKFLFTCLLAILIGSICAQKEKENQILKELADNACLCIDSVNTYNKSQKKVSEEMSSCIDKQVLAYQLSAQIMGLDLNSSKKKNKKKKQTINIELSEDKNSSSYKSAYYELERYLMKNCESLKQKVSSQEKQSSNSMSKIPEAVQWYDLGIEAHKKGDFATAIKNYQQAIAIDSAFGFAWDNLGLAYRKNGQYENALNAYRKSIAIDSTGLVPWQNTAIVYEYLKDYPKAIAAYEALAKLDNQNPEVYYGLGRMYAFFTNDLAKGLDNLCIAYNFYVEQNSPYRTDAEQLINRVFTEMKKQGMEKRFNEILESHNIKQR